MAPLETLDVIRSQAITGCRSA